MVLIQAVDQSEKRRNRKSGGDISPTPVPEDAASGSLEPQEKQQKKSAGQQIQTAGHVLSEAAAATAADAIAAVLVRHRQTGAGGCPRLHTNLRVTIRSGEQSAEAQITNISRSGAFVRIDWPPRLGSVVDLDFTLPGTKSRLTVMAFVIHLAERRGFGVQFIGGSDEFRSRLDEYVARLSA